MQLILVATEYENTFEGFIEGVGNESIYLGCTDRGVRDMQDEATSRIKHKYDNDYVNAWNAVVENTHICKENYNGYRLRIGDVIDTDNGRQKVVGIYPRGAGYHPVSKPVVHEYPNGDKRLIDFCFSLQSLDSKYQQVTDYDIDDLLRDRKFNEYMNKHGKLAKGFNYEF